MNKEFKHFDMKRKVMRQRQYLRPITWLLSIPTVKSNHARITKVKCEGLKPPYVLLCNHNAFYDFKVATTAIFPHRANYVIAIDGFIGMEWLVRRVGGICKRKFTSDINLIKQLKRVIENGDVATIYPEARYSLCGTQSELPESLGQLCKMLRVPVVTINFSGHHIRNPFWNTRKRKLPYTEAKMTQLFTKEEIECASVDEVNEAIRNALAYDDFAWQKDNKIKVDEPFRAEGLHHVLYQCPACKTEFRMNSEGERIKCNECGKEWRMTEYGQLEAMSGETEFSHIPDWYEWQRQNVRREVREGSYGTELECHVKSLPNARGYIDIGEGKLIHNLEGFKLHGAGKYGDFEMERSAGGIDACHIEYNYLGKFGDCIDLNTLNDTYYIYPHGREFAVTKIALATEEIYRMIREGSHARKRIEPAK